MGDEALKREGGYLFLFQRRLSSKKRRRILILVPKEKYFQNEKEVTYSDSCSQEDVAFKKTRRYCSKEDVDYKKRRRLLIRVQKEPYFEKKK